MAENGSQINVFEGFCCKIDLINSLTIDSRADRVTITMSNSLNRQGLIHVPVTISKSMKYEGLIHASIVLCRLTNRQGLIRTVSRLTFSHCN